ncbi:MAG: 50S ribosomal protein L28 [Rickettsiales bacterium]|jgi:large subunit ribosomal protein L28|nr:50S ribosomal protein L28 [Rickettsiales bacterium]
MSNTCQITEKKLQFGNNVSHSKRKTRRTFLPNIQNASFLSKYLGKIQLKASPSAIRTVEINGGLDDYLLKTQNSKLSETSLKLKKTILRIQKKLTAK